jgi:glycosyltransferase involved in cell wall biosynthesis
VLTILQVAYPFAPVGPDAVGGAEQILHQIDRALVRAGWNSVVIACAGSRIDGTLVPTPALPALLDDTAKHAAWRRHRHTIEEVIASQEIDVVHLHGVDFLEYLPRSKARVLATLHLPPDWYDASVYGLGIRLACVSQHQHAACPASSAEIAVIANGVDLDQFVVARKRRFALCLARICPEKGVHLALEAARLADMPFALGGQVFPYAAHEEYFRHRVAPLLDRRRRFLGPVGLRRKRRLLAAARCLLVPSEVSETSSLVAMEALASGTPVIAFRRGALPEIVEHGRTGFLVDSVEEMAAAIDEAGSLDPALCRATARRRFSAERMTADYLRLYREIASAQA